MLIELGCSKFIESPLYFKPGLNVVLGDNIATNSIGKSSILLLIDFALGGNSFIKFDNGAIANLGHHEYNFCFLFEGNKYYFKRDTQNWGIVHECNEKYETLNSFPLEQYYKFLTEKYRIHLLRSSFRKFIGLFSRVWGKENLEVNKPLNIASGENMTTCVTHLIDFFGLFQNIDDVDAQLKAKTEEKKGLLSAYRFQFIAKINKNRYNLNIKTVKTISTEIEHIKQGLARRMCDINQILNTEIAELKIRKDSLLNSRSLAANKLERIEKNINLATLKHTGEIAKLKLFFSNIDEDRLKNVEEFHLGISKILLTELEKSKLHLQSEMSEIDNALSKINVEINSKISTVANASPLVDRIFTISSEFETLSRENLFYETEKRLKSEEVHLKEMLNTLKIDILKQIQNSINTKIQDFVGEIYGKDRKSPILNLEPARYSYKTVDDTGTGKFYSNLILFDLAVFALTNLPLLVHDSILFKNIENRAVDGLIKLYLCHKKQSFISIDEINKYDVETQKHLTNNTVLNLANDKLLYVKDWRKKP